MANIGCYWRELGWDFGLCWVGGPAAAGDAPMLLASMAVGRFEHLQGVSAAASVMFSASSFPKHLSAPFTPAEPPSFTVGVNQAGLWFSYSPSLVPLDHHPPVQ